MKGVKNQMSNILEEYIEIVLNCKKRKLKSIPIDLVIMMLINIKELQRYEVDFK